MARYPMNLKVENADTHGKVNPFAFDFETHKDAQHSEQDFLANAMAAIKAAGNKSENATNVFATEYFKRSSATSQAIFGADRKLGKPEAPSNTGPATAPRFSPFK